MFKPIVPIVQARPRALGPVAAPVLEYMGPDGEPLDLDSTPGSGAGNQIAAEAGGAENVLLAPVAAAEDDDRILPATPVAARRTSSGPPTPSNPPSPSPKKTATVLEETAAARAGKRKNAELHNLITQLNSPVSPEVVDIKKRKVDLEEKRLDV